MAGITSYNYQQEHDRKLAQSVCVGAVVQVTEFDPAKMIVTVQPLSKQLENGNYESQPPILDIPVAVTRCGGFIYRPWYKEGDVGVILYIDHDIDSVVAGGKEVSPSTERNHSTSDAVFVGGIISGDYKSEGLPEESVAIATEDGKIYVAVEKDKITIKHNDAFAEMTADTIKADAPSEIDATVGGTNVNLTPDSITMTTTTVTINAGGDVSIVAGGTMTLQGATININ